MSCVRFLPTSYLSSISVRADDFLNVNFGSLTHIIKIHVVRGSTTTELLSHVIKELSGQCCRISRSNHFVRRPPSKREARKILYFERYSPVILRILMYREVDKIKLGKTLFPNWRHISSKNK